LKLLILY